MDSGVHQSFLLADRSYLSLIKKDIHQIAADAGFSPAQLGNIDLIVAEIGSNIIKHAGSGELLVHTTGEHISIFGIDNGPGMADTPRMMEDGVSTTNTLGGGLGAIKRLSDSCQVYSLKDWGTIVFARVLLRHKKTAEKIKLPVQHYALLVPYPGEQLCGDGFSMLKRGNNLIFFTGDGLGHGSEANKAVQEAIEALTEGVDLFPADVIRTLHPAVKKTRGLVGTIVIYMSQQRCWKLCGVGNVSTRIQTGMIHKSYMSYNGIIGHSVPRTLNDQTVEAQRGQYVICCSDGIRTRWDTTKYPHIFRYDPCIMAAAIYKDHARRTDDASVVVMRVT